MTTAQPFTGELLPLKRSIARPSIAVYLFHRFQERIRKPRARKRLSDAIALLRGRRAATPVPDTMAPDMATLDRDGTMMLPGYLSPERAATLRAVLQAMPCRDPWKADRGTFMLADAPADTHVADIVEAPLLKVAHDIAFDERLLALATEYFGSTPYVDSIQAWWSLASSGEPEEAENFHRDNDGIRFLKFFLYLTNVDDTQGPHKFVLGSHIEPKLLGRRRLTDAEVEDAFSAQRIRTVTGRAGDAFIEDTFGIHKGQQPASGTRLLLQVRYSITPTIFRSRMIVDASVPDRVSKPISLIHDA